MAKQTLITAAMIEAAIVALEERAANPVTPSQQTFTRKEAFEKLRSAVLKARGAGHSLAVVLDDLKGVGIGMTLGTAKQYLKPPQSKKRKTVQPTSAAAVSMPTSDSKAPNLSQRRRSRASQSNSPSSGATPAPVDLGAVKAEQGKRAGAFVVTQDEPL